MQSTLTLSSEHNAVSQEPRSKNHEDWLRGKVLEQVLDHLEPTDLLRGTSVSKEWKRLIDDGLERWQVCAQKQGLPISGTAPELKSATCRALAVEANLLAGGPLSQWRLRFAYKVMHTRWSHDGSKIAAASIGGIRVFDVAHGRELCRTYGWQVWGLAWRPDDTMIAAAVGGICRVIHPETGRVILDFAHSGLNSGPIWSPDGEKLATGMMHWNARITNVADGTTLANIVHGNPALIGVPFYNCDIRSMCWRQDSQVLATASCDYQVRMICANSGNVLAVLPYSGEVRCLSWSPVDNDLASGACDGQACIQNGADGAAKLRIHHDGAVRALAWSADGEMLATGAADGTVRITDAESGEQVRLIQHPNSFVSLKWAHFGHTIATLSFDGTLRVTDTRSRVPSRSHQVAADSLLHEHAWSPDDSKLAVGVGSRTAQIIDLQSNTLMAGLEHGSWWAKHHWGFASPSQIQALRWNRNGSNLAVASRDHTVSILNAKQNRRLAVVRHHGWVTDVSWNPNFDKLASSGDDGTLRITSLGPAVVL